MDDLTEALENLSIKNLFATTPGGLRYHKLSSGCVANKNNLLLGTAETLERSQHKTPCKTCLGSHQITKKAPAKIASTPPKSLEKATGRN